MIDCDCTTKKRLPLIYSFFYKIDRIYLIIALVFVLLSVIEPDQVFPLGKLTILNLAHTAPYMLFAVLLIAVLKATGAEVLVARAFKGRENRMIILAALTGGLAPFCSCEVIPFIAGLLALGTPLSPIMAFWLSSPLIDPPTLLITAGVLGWTFAISKAIIAVLLGLMGGFIIKLFTTSGYFKTPLKPRSNAINLRSHSLANYNGADSCCETAQSVGEKPTYRFWSEESRMNVFKDEFKYNSMFLLKWMLFAYTLESLMIHYVPAETIASFVGGEGISPIILSAIIGVPAYLNSYIAPAIVSGLMDQGMSSGSAMAFIVAGAVSSIPAMTAVFALVHRRVFIAYVLLGLFGAVLSGITYGLIAS